MSYCFSCGHYSIVTGDGLCQVCDQSYYEQMSQYAQAGWPEIREESEWPEIWVESDANPEG